MFSYNRHLPTTQDSEEAMIPQPTSLRYLTFSPEPSPFPHLTPSSPPLRPSSLSLRVDAESRGSLSLRAPLTSTQRVIKAVERFAYLHKLVLKCERNVESINDDGIQTIARQLPMLRKLKLKNCKQVRVKGKQRLAGDIDKVGLGVSDPATGAAREELQCVGERVRCARRSQQ